MAHKTSPTIHASELSALIERYQLSEDTVDELSALISSISLPATALPTVAPSQPQKLWASRYTKLGILGIGGMGEVWKVWDQRLERTAAMKVQHSKLSLREIAVLRFEEEAQLGAQLQHPGLLPVYDSGVLEDGRRYFTMQQVRGVELTQLILRVHRACTDGHWQATDDGWTLRRLILVFFKACQAVGFAHTSGIVHRDLKPHNIMIGDNGEVYVVDWGIAKIVGSAVDQASHFPKDTVTTHRTGVTAWATRAGTVAGTPAYMPPEQAAGAMKDATPTTDVYSLGAVLYTILSGRPPFPILGNPLPILEQVRTLTPRPLEEAAQPVPEELIALCYKAMSAATDARHAHAQVLAGEVSAWIDERRRRDKAQLLLSEAQKLLTLAQERRIEATQSQNHSASLLRAVLPSANESAKVDAWAAQSRTQALDREATALRLQGLQALQRALSQAPDLQPARVMLARIYQEEHRKAEAAKDEASTLTASVFLKGHVEELPKDEPVRIELEDYLEGKGTVTLRTEPAGATVKVLAYQEHPQLRRLVTEPVGTLGKTPLENVPLEMGSYLFIVEHPQCETVRYPVRITRMGRWDGVAPNADTSHTVHLPPAGSLTPDECYVPPGWFRASDASVPNHPPEMDRWVDGFVLQRFPITHKQYIAFLNDLIDHQRVDDALRLAPKVTTWIGDNMVSGEVYSRDARGQFVLKSNTNITSAGWEEDWPVFSVDWHSAWAYAQWWSQKTGQCWRLPSEWEIEKAARGVDGRSYTWGHHFDPSRACTISSYTDGPRPAPISDFPLDESPYRVRGLSGNIATWCGGLYYPKVSEIHVPPVASPSTDANAPRNIRGGIWLGNARQAHAAMRRFNKPSLEDDIVGIRLARCM